jgi:hypothetical protein
MSRKTSAEYARPTAVSETFFVDEPVLGRLRRLPERGRSQLADAHDAGRRALEEERVTGDEDLVAGHVGDPLALPPDGHDAHAGGHRQLEGAEGAVGQVRPVAHDDAVRDLLGVGQVGHELAWDAEPVRDDAGDVDRAVADALDRGDDLEDRRHGLGLAGAAGRQDAQRPHAVGEVVHPLLELVDLLGHVGVAEVQGRVGQVDHQLGGVDGLREHRAEVAGSVVHAAWRPGPPRVTLPEPGRPIGGLPPPGGTGR